MPVSGAECTDYVGGTAGWLGSRTAINSACPKDVATRCDRSAHARAIEVGTGEHAVFPTTLRAWNAPSCGRRAVSTPRSPPGSHHRPRLPTPPLDPTSTTRTLFPPAGAPTMIALPAEDPLDPRAPHTTRPNPRRCRRPVAAHPGDVAGAGIRATPQYPAEHRRALERALRWPPNSLDAALASGRPPVPTPTPTGGGQEARRWPNSAVGSASAASNSASPTRGRRRRTDRRQNPQRHRMRPTTPAARYRRALERALA